MDFFTWADNQTIPLRCIASSQMQGPTTQGVLIRVSSSEAASSKITVQFLCVCRYVAGTSDDISPSTVRLMISAFLLPQASNTIRLAFRIVPTPIVIARLGTFSKPWKSFEASERVKWSKVIIRVPELICEPGSLKPMCPVRPIPNIWKSKPP